MHLLRICSPHTCFFSVCTHGSLSYLSCDCTVDLSLVTTGSSNLQLVWCRSQGWAEAGSTQSEASCCLCRPIRGRWDSLCSQNQLVRRWSEGGVLEYTALPFIICHLASLNCEWFYNSWYNSKQYLFHLVLPQPQIDKPEVKSQSKVQAQVKCKKGKTDLGLWALT